MLEMQWLQPEKLLVVGRKEPHLTVVKFFTASPKCWKDEKAKEHFLRCLYFGHFFGDESGLMLNILDP